MKKIKLLFALLAGFGLGIAASALAQYQGPSSKSAKTQTNKPVRTVSDVLAHGHDDQVITLTGNVIRKIGRKKYIFSDNSGEIQIEIDKKVMPNEPFDEKTKVEIMGEVEKDYFQSVEIDVKAIRILR